MTEVAVFVNHQGFYKGKCWNSICLFVYIYSIYEYTFYDYKKDTVQNRLMYCIGYSFKTASENMQL